MPRGKCSATAKAVSAIFETFVQNLTAAVKDKVTQTVSKATEDFLTGRIAQTVKTAAKKLPRRLRRRRAKKSAAPRPGYSKNGKKLGRPPKRKGE